MHIVSVVLNIKIKKIIIIDKIYKFIWSLDVYKLEL